MSLVVFNHDVVLDAAVNDFEETLQVPTRARRAKWKLHAVNVLLYSTNRREMAYVDVSFPQLMNSENFVSVSEGGAPARAFRFYTNHFQISGNNSRREFSVCQVVSEYPNWDLGEHFLDNEKLTCIVRPMDGQHRPVPTRGHSIILSFEE